MRHPHCTREWVSTGTVDIIMICLLYNNNHHHRQQQQQRSLTIANYYVSQNDPQWQTTNFPESSSSSGSWAIKNLCPDSWNFKATFAPTYPKFHNAVRTYVTFRVPTAARRGRKGQQLSSWVDWGLETQSDWNSWNGNGEICSRGAPWRWINSIKSLICTLSVRKQRSKRAITEHQV